jgi:pimeloyl-ACP methyl ester carboxylesterase
MSRKLNFGSCIAILVAVASALCGAHSARSAEPAGDCSVEGRLRLAAVSEGKRIKVQIEGEGPDVILIPGLATPGALWSPTAAKLANCYRLHIVQLRGFGDQALRMPETGELVGLARGGTEHLVNMEGPVFDPFVDELADYIDKEIIKKGGKPPAIVGHSMGGLAAMKVALDNPHLVSRVMVVDALPFIGTLFAPDATVESTKPRAEAMYRAALAQPAPSTRQLVTTDPGAMSQAGFWTNNPEGRIWVTNWTAASVPSIVAKVMFEVMQTDLRPQLPKMQVPLTLLYAQDDSVMPPERARMMFEAQYSGAPDFSATMIDGSRHFIMIDQPEKFQAELEAFLNGGSKD